mmetsp:Transcript_8985/g.16732  ORF Transcript_8985/g.16732 Transcript_8985/m.16732 type:complete len:279 (-) Transcript_8985:633-1469(-)
MLLGDLVLREHSAEANLAVDENFSLLGLENLSHVVLLGVRVREILLVNLLEHFPHATQRPLLSLLIILSLQQALSRDPKVPQARGKEVVPLHLQHVGSVLVPHFGAVVQNQHRLLGTDEDVKIFHAVAYAVILRNDVIPKEGPSGVKQLDHLQGVPTLAHGVNVHIKELARIFQELGIVGPQLGPHVNVIEKKQARLASLGLLLHHVLQERHFCFCDVLQLRRVQKRVVQVEHKRQFLLPYQPKRFPIFQLPYIFLVYFQVAVQIPQADRLLALFLGL